jgi:hypothetical protein
MILRNDMIPHVTLRLLWYCDMMAKVTIIEPAEMTTTREWTCKCHVTADYHSDRGNRGILGRGVFCVV